MKVKSIQKIDASLLEQHLFGIKYTINSNGVNISTFTPTLLSDVSHQSTHLSRSSCNTNQFQVSFLEPFFLHLQSTLNGLYEECLFLLPEMLTNKETINIIWLFHMKKDWRYEAIDMYESYLEGNNNPSDIPIFRKFQDKVYEYTNKLSSTISKREYSQDVEDKILSDGYAFQCIVEIKSDRSESLSSIIQDIFIQYDFHNGLRMERAEYRYPYNFYPTNQLLSKNEILSLFTQTDAEIDLSENPIQEKINSTVTNWDDRIKLLPHIPNTEIKADETIVPRLADALKRVGIINQARLYNESIQQGSRLTVIVADTPKNKNFSDIEKKRKDIQAALGVESLSIEQGNEPNTIKYSIPHHKHQIVSLRELIERKDFQEYAKNHSLAFIVGNDEINNPIYLSLEELRHILITGSQGSGKSVFLNQLITTLLMTHTPEELQFIMIDPKQVELNQYKNFPHVQNVITDMKEAMRSFNGLIKEMEGRYKLLAEHNVKNIQGYNAKVGNKLPFISCVIEEWADLFSVAGKDAEEVVLRLGQKARAAGIFLIIVTQRPSAKILSGDIKANIQSKFSFNLGNNTNYRTVFDSGIPFSQLLGKGDGVFSIEGYHKEFQRFQSPILARNDVEESVVFENILKTYEDKPGKSNVLPQSDSVMDRLKQIIATTNETRVTVLREKLSVKSDVITTLMSRLVDEGWLIRHKNRQKGYELVADENILNEWREDNGN